MSDTISQSPGAARRTLRERAETVSAHPALSKTSYGAGRKVVVIAGQGWSLVNFRLELLKRMVAGGHDVLALAPEFDAETLAELSRWRIRTGRIVLDRTGTNPLRDMATTWSIYRILRRERPDVVLAYTMKPIVYGSLAARLAGVRDIYALFTGLGYAFMDGQPSAKRQLVRRVTILLHRLALGRITQAFCYNDQEDRDIRSFRLIPPETGLTVVPGSGVDTARFDPAPPVCTPVRFVFIGRMLASKGLGVLMQAQRHLRDKGVHAEVHLVGPFDSNPDAIATAQVQEWQDAGLATYHGETRDVRPFLAASTVFVLPTFLREGVPRTILEAMAAGRAVITTDAPGCGSTIVDGESGLVVPAGKVGPLADAMQRFVDEPELAVRMGKAARLRAETCYDVSIVNAMLLQDMKLEMAAVPPITDTRAQVGP